MGLDQEYLLAAKYTRPEFGNYAIQWCAAKARMHANVYTNTCTGMGNRFASMAEYHGLIKAHAIIAAITFLGIVPCAILTARFYYRDPRFALKTHISLQVLTLILSTVVLVLGYFAVGPSRSLTNPHHGIGVAIYVLIIIQALGGSIIHKIEKGKVRYYLPIKLMVSWYTNMKTGLITNTA